MYNPQIRTFLTVAEKGSFTAAAASLYISPSAVFQQINALEKDFGVALVNRQRNGITLTEAGIYLNSAARKWVQEADSIRARVTAVSDSSHTISIATSLLEKSRLLYELWMLYAEEEPSTRVNMLTIGPDRRIPPEADLVESVNSRVAWMREWNFMQICRVPLGFAMVSHHRLASRDRLSLPEIAEETVVCFEVPEDSEITKACTCLKESGVSLEIHSMPEHSVLWNSNFRRRVMLAPQCWMDILPGMTFVPADWNLTIPYGVFFREDTTKAVRGFLRFIEETYTTGNRQGIVPVLDFFADEQSPGRGT